MTTDKPTPELFEKCPQCNGDGWYVQPNYHTGDAEQAQCEYCMASGYIPHTQPAAQKTEGGATSMQILEVGKDQYGEPLTVMGKPNAVHALQTALASRPSVDMEAVKRWCDFWQQSKAHEQWTLHDLIDDLAAKFPELVGGRE